MLSAAPRLQRLCVGVRRPYLVAFTITLAALVSAIAASSIYAQTPDEHPTDKWVREGGTVQTNKATLTIREGETASYSVRLSKRPHNEDEKNDGWWVRILVDSANRADGEHDVDGDGQDDLRWVPSVGWEFDLDDWASEGPGPWRNISISALEDDDTNDQTITFAHELWDHNTYCPPKLHGSGSPLAVVTVHIIDNDDGNNENGNGNGGDNGNGNGNGGDNGNGDENGNLNGNGDGNGNENGTGNGEGNGDGDGNGNGNGGGNNGGGNDPSLPTLSIADATAAEGEPARFSVTLRPASEQTVTVSYRTAGGTAAAGLDFDTVSGTLTFAPRTTRQVIAVQTREDEIDEPDEAFTVTLSNPSGAVLAAATASGTITDDDVPTLSIAELSRALAFTAVRCRIEQAFSDMSRGWAKPSFQPSLSLVPPSLEWEEADARPPTLEQVLSSTSFLVPLMGEEVGAASFATWGCGDYRKLAGDGKGGIGPWDAETFSMQVGADAIVDTNVLAGVALSQSRGTLNFDEASGSGEAGVRYDLRLTGVHPYLGLWVSPDLEIWGALSLGRGTLRIADALAGASLTSAATLASGTVGLNGQLLKRGAMTLRLKGEGAIAHMDFARSSTAFRKMAIDLQRLRLAVEADYEQVIPYVGVLAPWGELGLRHDGGDGESGASLEIGGGLHLRNIEQGWNAEVYGRWLAVREGERPEEQGIGARFRYDPDAPGFGPWVSLTQSWGETASGLPRLWKDDAINLKSHNPSAGRLDAELAYGFSAFSGQGTITPYGAMSLKSTDGRSYRLGGRFMLGSWATVSVDAERREHLAEAPAYTVTIGGTVRF